MIENKCKNCGNKFKSNRTFAKFCSDACRMTNYRKRKNSTTETMHQQAMKLLDFKLEYDFPEKVITINDIVGVYQVMELDLNEVFDQGLMEIETKEYYLKRIDEQRFYFSKKKEMTEKEFEVFEETMIPIIDAIEAKKNVICSAVKTHFEAPKEETNDVINHLLLMKHTLDQFYKIEEGEPEKIILSINNVSHHIELTFIKSNRGFYFNCCFDVDFTIEYDVDEGMKYDGVDPGIYFSLIVDIIENLEREDEINLFEE